MKKRKSRQRVIVFGVLMSVLLGVVPVLAQRGDCRGQGGA